ncbi:MAG TPA: hypothetical protein VJ842_01855 [Pyrinomonadaceae bacterium]|nr:hypothetical protein [Pyrinomonadaceae bacterium]
MKPDRFVVEVLPASRVVNFDRATDLVLIGQVELPVLPATRASVKLKPIGGALVYFFKLTLEAALIFDLEDRGQTFARASS